MPLSARMGELERAVMEQLWARDAAADGAAGAEGAAEPATVREVHEALAASRDVAYTTVMTVLDRLAKKGLVTQERDGRAYRYRPAASRGAMTADLMRDALREFSADDRRTALLAFVGEASEEERAALRQALAELE